MLRLYLKALFLLAGFLAATESTAQHTALVVPPPIGLTAAPTGLYRCSPPIERKLAPGDSLADRKTAEEAARVDPGILLFAEEAEKARIRWYRPPLNVDPAMIFPRPIRPKQARKQER